MLKKSLLISFFTLSAISAQAYDIPTDYYLRVDAGHQMTAKMSGPEQYLKSSAVGYNKATMKKNMGFNLGIGMYFPNQWRADVTIGIDNFKLSGSNNVVTTIGNTDMKARSTHAILNGYYDILDINGLVPFVTVGAGYAKNKLSSNLTSLKLKGKGGIAWQVGAGAAYHFNEQFAVELSYRYSDLGVAAKASNISTALKGATPPNPAYIQKDPKLTAGIAVLGVRFSF